MRAMLDYEPGEIRKEFERGDIVRIISRYKNPQLSTNVEVGDQGVVEYASGIGPIQVLIPGRSLRGNPWLRQFVNPDALERVDKPAIW